MSGDAKECREHALRCEQFAEHVPTLTGRQMYLDLARTWRRLGEELESAQSFVALVNGSCKSFLDHNSKGRAIAKFLTQPRNVRAYEGWPSRIPQ